MKFIWTTFMIYWIRNDQPSSYWIMVKAKYNWRDYHGYVTLLLPSCPKFWSLFICHQYSLSCLLKFSNSDFVLIVVQIPVKSLSDFYGLYFAGSSSNKQGQKNTNEPPPRSHRGLIVHISSTNEIASETRFVSKMNFVDMAGS